MARTLSRTGAIAALAVAVMCHAAIAFAQEGWGTAPFNLSTPVSTGGAIFQPKLDVDGAGNAFAIWTDQGPNGIGTGAVVRSARYDAALRQWSGPLTLSTGERIAAAGDIAADAAGNAVAVWRINTISTPFFGRVSRYDATTRQWAYVDLGPLNFAIDDIAVALNDAGAGAVCWSSSASAGVACKRYTPGSGWAEATTVAAAGVIDGVGVDAAGTIHVLWHTSTSLQTARFDAGTSTWGSVVDLATGLPTPPFGRVAVNGPGHAVAAWVRGATVEVSTLASAGAAWTAASTLSSGGTAEDYPRPAIDATGRATVAWAHTAGGARTMRVSRRDPAGAAWSAAIDLPGQIGGFAYGPPAIDVDTLGNVHVVWSQSLASPGLRLLAARFAVSTGQWTAVTNLSTASQFAYNADVATDAAGNATAVWFQTASGFSLPQALRWHATPAEPLVSNVATTSGGLTVSFSPHAGSDPALAQTNIEYSLDGGATWTPRAPADPSSPLAISGLVDGTRYALQLRAVNAAGAGRASTTLGVRSGTDTAPGSLRVVSRTGNTLTLAWTAPPAGLEPTSYRIEGGLAGQAPVLAVLPTGGAATQFTVTVPDGTFFVRVTAMFGTTVLGTSAERTIAAGVGGAPPAPGALLGSASGQVLALSWRNALEGPAPAGIRLSVTGALTTTLDLPATESFTYPTVPAGTYTFTVSALNGTAVSAVSTPVTLTFPGTCAGVPNPPSGFSASTQGGSVFLDWLPPSSGEAVTSYVVSVTGAFTGTLPMTARTLSTPAPPGSYTVRVASIGLCGTSAFTAPQTIVVP